MSTTALLPLFVLNGSAFASPAPTPAVTATQLVGAQDATASTFLLACDTPAPTPAPAAASTDCPLPAGATFTLTAAPGAINQSYTNTELQLTYTQHCALLGTHTLSAPAAATATGAQLPTDARCTLAYSGLPPSHSEQTLTLDVRDAFGYYRAVPVVADNATTAPATDSTTTTTTLITIAPSVSTAPAVTSFSVIIVTPPPAPSTSTFIVTVGPSASLPGAAAGSPYLTSYSHVLAGSMLLLSVLLGAVVVL